MPVHNYYKSKNNDDLIGFIVTFGYNKCIYDIYESYDSYYNDTYVDVNKINVSSADKVVFKDSIMIVKEKKNNAQFWNE